MKEETETLVCIDIGKRAVEGRCKYGVTVADNPLTLRQWLQHAYEEMLDQCVYLRRAMQEMDEKAKPVKWRCLNAGEPIQEGDQYFLDGKWHQTYRPIGDIPDDPNKYRRRITPDLSELNQHITELLKHE